MGISIEQVERMSQKTRHYRLHLNRISDQKLQERISDLTDQYEKTCHRLRTDQKLEEHRKQLLNLTVQKLVTERHASAQRTASQISSKSSIFSREKSCGLFSSNCKLYPCQPVYNYTSFIKKENDRTIRAREQTVIPTMPANLREMFGNIEEDLSQQGFGLTLRNQYHLANRHLSMKRAMTRLDEQSRLLHERLIDKKQFVHAREDQYALKQAIKRHLEISAKFCAEK